MPGPFARPYPARCRSTVEKAAWYALADVLAYAPREGMLAGTLRAVVLAKSLLEDGEATCAEMAPWIGEKWGLCRNTAANRARYVNCITRKQYEAAGVKAINARVDRIMAEKYNQK